MSTDELRAPTTRVGGEAEHWKRRFRNAQAAVAYTREVRRHLRPLHASGCLVLFNLGNDFAQHSYGWVAANLLAVVGWAGCSALARKRIKDALRALDGAK